MKRAGVECFSSLVLKIERMREELKSWWWGQLRLSKIGQKYTVVGKKKKALFIMTKSEISQIV